MKTNNTVTVDGRPRQLLDTSKGRMTIYDMIKIHPYDMDYNSMRYRGRLWGFDHKAMWFEKLNTQEAKQAAILLDGPPRGVDADKDYNPANHVRQKSAVDQPINRLKCCHREKGTVKCVHYAKRLALIEGWPSVCDKAVGTHCPNFDGEEIEISHMFAGRYASKYLLTGAGHGIKL